MHSPNGELSPVTFSQNDRNDAGLAGAMTLHRAVISLSQMKSEAKKSGADEQENDLRLFQLPTDFRVPLRPASDISIGPLPDKSLPFQRGQVFIQLITV